MLHHVGGADVGKRCCGVRFDLPDGVDRKAERGKEPCGRDLVGDADRAEVAVEIHIAAEAVDHARFLGERLMEKAFLAVAEENVVKQGQLGVGIAGGNSFRSYGQPD